MKRKVLQIFAVVISTVFIFTGCQQTVTKSFGGTMTLELEPNQKLEEITWKDDSLWYLTRPMRSDEKAETYIFRQSSEFGVFEGAVEVIESKE